MVDIKQSFLDNIKRCLKVHTGLLIWGKCHLIQRFARKIICLLILFFLSIISLFFRHFGNNISKDSKCKHYISNIAYDRKRVSLTLLLNLHCLKIH